MAIFNSYVSHYQRVGCISIICIGHTLRYANTAMENGTSPTSIKTFILRRDFPLHVWVPKGMWHDSMLSKDWTVRCSIFSGRWAGYRRIRQWSAEFGSSAAVLVPDWTSWGSSTWHEQKHTLKIPFVVLGGFVLCREWTGWCFRLCFSLRNIYSTPQSPKRIEQFRKIYESDKCCLFEAS